MPARILVVDDDPHIREVICFALTAAGMVPSVARDGAEALAAIEADEFDLVVLDIGLPEIDGLEVCRRIRKSGDQPILFLSSRSDEIDRIVGFELGGDDYVVKPFSPRELVARVSAILKRGRSVMHPVEEPVIRHGALTLDSARFRAAYAESEIALTQIEFTILRAMAEQPGIVLDRNALVSTAYPRNTNVSGRTIDSHVRNIRAKFIAVGCPEIVDTVHGIGFRLASIKGGDDAG